VLWAGAPEAGPPRLRADVALDARLRTPALALERLLVRHDPSNGHVLTDDLSDVDQLTDQDLGEP
jgi:hypothetical protein